MADAASPIRALLVDTTARPQMAPESPSSLNEVAGDAARRVRRKPKPRLSRVECILALLALILWLLLFGGGILVDSEPYRNQISAEGVQALRAEGRTRQGLSVEPAAGAEESADSGALLAAWAVVLSCFLPLNLAWLCVAASTLGAFGSAANLHDDEGDHALTDSSNPYVSAMLRGFFVYLFMMSGLLVLDDAPFSNAGPGQYIRLAGFLSLFSFVVSYQPRLFGALIVSAFQRIQVRGGDTEAGTASHSQVAQIRETTTVQTVDIGREVHTRAEGSAGQ